MILREKAGQVLDKTCPYICKIWIFFIYILYVSVRTLNNSEDSESRGVFLWYESLSKPSAEARVSKSAVKWLVFYWWAPEVASVGNWIFDLLEFGKYILSVWSSPGGPPHLRNAATLHIDTRFQADWHTVWYSSSSPKHIFVLDVFTESLHGDYRCSLTKLGICFKL